ncbi:NAD(P)-dependent dehydrogenase (short-subunit alcohol dehydrogenase family) [Nocardia sp. GAS34]|uniref:hypothetical protein n=1 Tax=unclassified Nocardia TaxID=2637762 RepID=UPI003D209319
MHFSGRPCGVRAPIMAHHNGCRLAQRNKERLHTALAGLPEDCDGVVADLRSEADVISLFEQGTIGEPEQIAASHLYFMQNSFVTGTILTVDGGLLLA